MFKFLPTYPFPHDKVVNLDVYPSSFIHADLITHMQEFFFSFRFLFYIGV